MNKCDVCGKRISKKHSFCPKCGTSIDTNKPQPRHSRLLITLLIISSFALICTLVCFFLLNNNRSFSDDPDKITTMSNSVVMLECYTPTNELYSTGSGFAIFEDDIIVTNYHVIKEEVNRIVVKTENGKTYIVNDVIAVSKAEDIAILRLEENASISALKYNTTHPLTKGEKVVAIGSPLGLKNTVSNGIISGYAVEDYVEVIQFTAPISSGSSGGALFNDHGEIIGITFASYTDGQNLNLAIPIKLVESLWLNRNPAKAVPVKVFYQTEPKKLTVSEALKNYKQYLGKEHYIEGYVSSINFDDNRDFGYIHLYLCSSSNEITNNETKDKKAYRNGQKISVYKSELNDNMRSVCSTISAGDYIRVYGTVAGHILLSKLDIKGENLRIEKLK